VLRKHEEIDEVRGILNDYMNASGANINEYKSCALALGTWPKSAPIMNIRYTDNIKILRFQMNDNCQHSAEVSWTTLTSKIRAQAMENYHRALNLTSRIHFVNAVLLATAWYKAQISPLQMTAYNR